MVAFCTISASLHLSAQPTNMSLQETPIVTLNQEDLDAGIVFGGPINLLDVTSVNGFNAPRPQQTIHVTDISGTETSTEDATVYYIVFNYRQAGRAPDKWRFKTSDYRDAKLTEVLEIFATELDPASSP